MTRVEAAYFDELYERSTDPWNFAASSYERSKYAHTARVLGPAGRLLEVGCSIGELTAVLAARSESVLGIDVSQRAVDLARVRLAGVKNAAVACGRFPEWIPDGDWDAIVCSEVLYYLDPSALGQAAEHFAAALSAGGRVLLVHWRMPAPSNALQGDELHDALYERLSQWHALDERRPRYRLDLFRG